MSNIGEKKITYKPITYTYGGFKRDFKFIYGNKSSLFLWELTCPTAFKVFKKSFIFYMPRHYKMKALNIVFQLIDPLAGIIAIQIVPKCGTDVWEFIVYINKQNWSVIFPINSSNIHPLMLTFISK